MPKGKGYKSKKSAFEIKKDIAGKRFEKEKLKRIGAKAKSLFEGLFESGARKRFKKSIKSRQ